MHRPKSCQIVKYRTKCCVELSLYIRLHPAHDMKKKHVFTFADKMTHSLHMSILTALRSARLRGEPFNTLILGRFWRSFHSSAGENRMRE